MYSGLLLTIIVGAMQGFFIKPMTMTKNWKWEHYWFGFAFLGMLIFNILLAFLFLPDLMSVYSQTEPKTFLILVGIGLVWGVGSILFGKGMDLLGFSLGYPVIMGTTAGFGTLIPAIISQPEIFSQFKGLMLISGVILSIAGIIICARATNIKNQNNLKNENINIQKTSLITALIIGVLAGIISSAPSLAVTVSKQISLNAISNGANPVIADGAVWAILFSTGSISNLIYCFYIMVKNKNLSELRNKFMFKNIALVACGSFIWIASLYLYGVGASLMGKLGIVLGWAILIVVSICVGNLIGIINGEWMGAPSNSKKLLFIGLLVLVFSIGIITFVK
jgi:L-rhamnose-H+ transport protein